MKHPLPTIALLLLLMAGIPVVTAQPIKKNWQDDVSTVLGVPAKEIFYLGWRDLTGSPSTLSFRYPTRSDNIKRDAGHPALFVRWSDANNRLTYVEALTYENDTFKNIWRTELSGPGFQSINDINLGPRKSNGMLDIVLYKTSLPQSGSMLSPPGPPQKFHYVYDGSVYNLKASK